MSLAGYSKSLAVLCCLTVAFATSVSTAALAQAYDCEKYARDAVAAHRFSQENYCGFGGPQWSYNYQAHRDWCLGAQYSSIMQEAGIRGRFVAVCRRALTDCNA